jgi:hypothetical protein
MMLVKTLKSYSFAKRHRNPVFSKNASVKIFI